MGAQHSVCRHVNTGPQLATLARLSEAFSQACCRVLQEAACKLHGFQDFTMHAAWLLAATGFPMKLT